MYVKKVPDKFEAINKIGVFERKLHQTGLPIHSENLHLTYNPRINISDAHTLSSYLSSVTYIDEDNIDGIFSNASISYDMIADVIKRHPDRLSEYDLITELCQYYENRGSVKDTAILTYQFLQLFKDGFYVYIGEPRCLRTLRIVFPEELNFN